MSGFFSFVPQKTQKCGFICLMHVYVTSLVGMVDIFTFYNSRIFIVDFFIIIL